MNVERPAAPPLGKAIALAFLALAIMVALGVWGVFRHAREQERLTREGGGMTWTAPAAP